MLSPWCNFFIWSTANHAGEMQDFWGFQKTLSTPVIKEGAKEISRVFQKLNNPVQPLSKRFSHLPIVFVFKNLPSGSSIRSQFWAYRVRSLPFTLVESKLATQNLKELSHFGGCLRPHSRMKFGDLGGAHFPSLPSIPQIGCKFEAPRSITPPSIIFKIPTLIFFKLSLNFFTSDLKFFSNFSRIFITLFTNFFIFLSNVTKIPLVPSKILFLWPSKFTPDTYWVGTKSFSKFDDQQLYMAVTTTSAFSIVISLAAFALSRSITREFSLS